MRGILTGSIWSACSKMPYKGVPFFKPGNKVGRLTLLRSRRVGQGRARLIFWKYKCVCGKRGEARNSNLKSGSTNSCGCLRADLFKEKQVLFPGDKVGRLTLISRSHKKTARSTNLIWKCKCDCGKASVAHQANLASGITSSCGCFSREIRGVAQITHGESDKAPEWFSWMNMIQRCENKKDPAYKNYGGRGIHVCRKWRKSYTAFLADVGRRPSSSHTINRKNNNKGYSPRNVNWADRFEQARNRRSNVILKVNGISKTAIEWARLLSIRPTTLYGRLRKGWSLEEALTPVKLVKKS